MVLFVQMTMLYVFRNAMSYPSTEFGYPNSLQIRLLEDFPLRPYKKNAEPMNL